MQRDISKFVKKRSPPAEENRDVSSFKGDTGYVSKGQPGSASAPGGGGGGLLKLLNGSSRQPSSSSQTAVPRAALLRVLEAKPPSRGAASADSKWSRARQGAIPSTTGTVPTPNTQPVPQPFAASGHNRTGNTGANSSLGLEATGPHRQRPGHAGERYWECYRRNAEPVDDEPEHQHEQEQQLKGQGQGQVQDRPVVVLGGSSKRAAMKRAGLDSARLQEIREVRARIETSSRYNHWADGGGQWDSEMIGIDGADDVGMRWEGVGCTTTGPRI
ncbi:hypothetical protein CHLRE_06g266550v5 [Chlamydomonas reinhardtii]|uniref:Uncharacterized protein n=1 Tax=Chlamydomonas reinhardtii TaxID=3055 RepID=A8HWN5_CHLRE|nr:uncharacterized protein CHLRE_06g266550v5 [Chlamydomonas reinhardtii]PNW81927.1 hypothetical protein CHLRE_06g266550v5 [Chlamydomonas reinhardtii]|eukprot:XP_001696540.1 predicted protein [Chlamydomonas reinhardtii]